MWNICRELLFVVCCSEVDCMQDTEYTRTLIPSARNQLFPASFLHFSSLPASYYFYSITRTSGGGSEASGIVATSTSVVVLLSGTPPTARIKCITGCSRPHSKSNPIWLEGACDNCRGNAEQLSYGWTFNYALQSNAYLRGFNWVEDSATGNRGSYVVVYPDKFMKSVAQDEFSFTLTGKAGMNSTLAVLLGLRICIRLFAKFWWQIVAYQKWVLVKILGNVTCDWLEKT